MPETKNRHSSSPQLPNPHLPFTIPLTTRTENPRQRILVSIDPIRQVEGSGDEKRRPHRTTRQNDPVNRRADRKPQVACHGAREGDGEGGGGGAQGKEQKGSRSPEQHVADQTQRSRSSFSGLLRTPCRKWGLGARTGTKTVPAEN